MEAHPTAVIRPRAQVAAGVRASAPTGSSSARAPLEEALREMGRTDDEHVRHLAAFIRGSRRGFSREERRGREAAEEE